MRVGAVGKQGSGWNAGPAVIGRGGFSHFDYFNHFNYLDYSSSINTTLLI